MRYNRYLSTSVLHTVTAGRGHSFTLTVVGGRNKYYNLKSSQYLLYTNEFIGRAK
jgi:hypothetical protein